MSKRFKSTVTVVAPTALALSPSCIDWSKCCICQKSGGVTVCSAKNPIPSLRTRGYSVLASAFDQLRPFDFTLPSGLKVSVLDEGHGIETVLINKSALWHKSCSIAYTEPKRFKALVTTLAEVENSSQCVPEECVEPSTSNDNTEVNRRTTRSTAPIINVKEDICFICTAPATRGNPLRRCETENIYEQVQNCARILEDTQLQALLILDGDLVAQEAKYHPRCMVRLYNRCRQKSAKSDGEQDAVICEGLAFADLVMYMQRKIVSMEEQCVFRMADLRTMYICRLSQLRGVEETSLENTKSTNLRLKILSYFPELKSEKPGRDYFLMPNNAQILNHLDREDQDEDAIAFHRFVGKLRNAIDDASSSFTGTFDYKCQEKCIPSALLATINMVLYGSAIKTECRATLPALTICQLIMLNFRQKKPKGNIVRHNKHHEPPLPLYLGLSSYGRNRDKRQIDELHEMGISVSYDRVMELTSQLCRLVVKRAKDEGAVCPSNLKRNIFTVAALDNIDHKPTSTTSEGEFHGTDISVFQLLSDGDRVEPRTFKTNFSDVAQGGVRSVPELPDSYAIVPEFILNNKQPPHPGCTPEIVGRISSTGEINWHYEKDWLEHVHQHLTDGLGEGLRDLSWGAFHASRDTSHSQLSSLKALLPLFHEKSTDVSMIKHGMDIVRGITQLLNGDQCPVLCVDQPLFALAKQVQFDAPNLYNKFVILFGPLHIELWFLRILGQLLDGSGWATIIANSEITTVGSAHALLKVTHITKARAIHQATAAVLHSLLKEAYVEENHDNDMSIEEWVELRASSCPTFKFWILVLNLEVLLLSFIRAVRQGNYELYKKTLMEMVPWCFLFDHHNYSRWLSVHILDLVELESKEPEIHRQFMLGKFVVRKTCRPFSALGIDQAHEQHNAQVKGKGGAIGLTQDPSALRRWTIGGPEVIRLLHEFAGDVDDSTDSYAETHHEQYASFQVKFMEKCTALKDSFLQCENPFLHTGLELIVLDTRVVVDEKGVAALYSAEEKGLTMFKHFVKERLQEKSKSLYEPIQRCQTKIFGAKKKSYEGMKMKQLQVQLQLSTRLFVIA